MRAVLASIIALVLVVSSAFAKEIKGTFVKIDEKSIVLKVEDKEETIKINAETKFPAKKGEFVTGEEGVKMMMKRAKEGTPVTVTTNDEGVATLIKAGGKKKTDK